MYSVCFLLFHKKNLKKLYINVKGKISITFVARNNRYEIKER